MKHAAGFVNSHRAVISGADRLPAFTQPNQFCPEMQTGKRKKEPALQHVFTFLLGDGIAHEGGASAQRQGRRDYDCKGIGIE